MEKKLIILVIVTLLGVQIAFSQTEKQVASIRNQVNSINKQSKKYTKTTKHVEGISLEGTEATYFTSGKDLKKIIAKSFGETYKATTELYYSGEELIFVFQKFYRYDTQIGMVPPPKIVSVKETRFYYSGGRLVKFLDGKKAIRSTTKYWDDSDNENKTLSEKLKEAFETN